MTIFQTNTWTCEVCGVIFIQGKYVHMYADPIVVPHRGKNGYEWGYTSEDILACPECIEKDAQSCKS